MSKSKVYWFEPRGALSTVVKGQRLFELASLNDCFSKGDTVAIKIHCGEWNNTGYLRPSIVSGIVETVKDYGGDPFVCDTTTLYGGARTIAQDMYKVAARNGFTSATLGCPFIVADGDMGTDDVKVRVDGNYLNYTYIAKAIANADAMIVLTHFKGHPSGIFGGAMKNVGIGCCSKRGKSVTHLVKHPRYGVPRYTFNPELCKGTDCPIYKSCSESCPTGAFQVVDEKPYARLDLDECSGCLGCTSKTECGVLSVDHDELKEMWQSFPATIPDSAKAVINHLGREHVGFISYAIDISPWCDCMGFTDSYILPNLGVYASKDIVSIDKACLDAADRTEGVPGSKAFDEDIENEPWKAGHEKFTYIPCSNRFKEVSQWIQINAASNIGLGSIDYELIEATPGPPEKYVMPKFREHSWGYIFNRRFKGDMPMPDLDCFKKKPKISIEELTKKPKL